MRVTARSTDWGLAILVALLAISGALTWFDGRAWVFVAHGIAGMALALLLVWKLPRVWPRVADPRRWSRRTWFGALALALVAATLVSGWLWSGVNELSLGGFTLLAWHDLLGALLALAVLAHLALRAKRPRRQDLGRRQLFTAGAIAAGGVLAWQLQRTLSSLFGLPAAERRFTGSYEAGSFSGNSFPVTSWVADDPLPSMLRTTALSSMGSSRGRWSCGRVSSSLETRSRRPSTARVASTRPRSGRAPRWSA